MYPHAGPRLAIVAIVIGMLAACSGGGPAADADEPADAPTTAADAAPSAEAQPADEGGGSSGATASITLTLTGGPHDGTHEAEAPDAGCSRNSVGDNTFGLQYSTGETAGFTSHQLVIRDAAAAASGSDDFSTDVFIDDAVYGIDSGAGVMNDPSGTGTVTLDDRGDTATITIEGETAEGIGFSAEIECHSVFGM